MAAFSMKTISDLDYWSVYTTGEINDVTQATESISLEPVVKVVKVWSGMVCYLSTGTE